MFDFLNQTFGDSGFNCTSTQSARQELMENVRSGLLRLGGLRHAAGTIIESIPNVIVEFQLLADSTAAAVFDRQTRQYIGSITSDGQIVYLHPSL